MSSPHTHAHACSLVKGSGSLFTAAGHFMSQSEGLLAAAVHPQTCPGVPCCPLRSWGPWKVKAYALHLGPGPSASGPPPAFCAPAWRSVGSPASCPVTGPPLGRLQPLLEVRSQASASALPGAFPPEGEAVGGVATAAGLS